MVNSLEDQYESILFAIAIWREARNQVRLARLGVKHTIINRTGSPKGPYKNCRTITQNILRGAYPSKLAAQFSSFNRSDPNSSLLPDQGYKMDWRAFIECCRLVEEDTEDPTGGATHYYDVSISAPYWATPSTFLMQLGDLRFHKLP